MSYNSIKNLIQNAGIAGAGGAGFPSYAKLSDNGGMKTIILNCAECEPLLTVDKLLLSGFAPEIFQGLKSVADVFDCDVIIAVKNSYEAAVAACEKIISNFERFKLNLLPDIYPSGDEVSLIYECTGRIVPEGGLPISAGVVVYNVETALNFYNALVAKQPVIYKYLTVAGEVLKPLTVKAPIGVMFGELIRLAGLITPDGYTIISGGPMTGKIASESDVVTKTTKGILVLKSDSAVVRKKLANPRTELRNAMSVCSQCRMCTDLCPRSLLGHKIEPHKFMRAAAVTVTLDNSSHTDAYVGSLNCCECGVCEMYACHQGLSPRKLLSECKKALRASNIKQQPKEDYHPNKMIKYRRINEHRLIMRLGLDKYEVPSEITDVTDKFFNVKLMRHQTIGVPPLPCVKQGDIVSLGDMVAEGIDGKLSLPIHSPISGIVTEITDTYIKVGEK